MRKAKAIFTAIVFSLGAGSIPAYASDPALRCFVCMEKLSGKEVEVSAEVLKRTF